MLGTLILLQIFLLVCSEQNITIDDTSPLINYNGIQFIERCSAEIPCVNEGLDLSKYHNSTLTKAHGGSITVNFTGTAIYAFFALDNPFLDETFSIDGVAADHKDTTPGWTQAYNVTVFRVTSLDSGPHFLNMSASSVGSFFLDYVIITQVVLLCSATSTSPISSASTTVSPSSTMPSASAPADSAVRQTKLSMGAIAGIGVGAAFISVMIAVAIYLCLRARKLAARAGDGHSSQPPPHATGTIPSPTATELVAEMRMMRSQVERLAADQRALQRGSTTSTFSELESPTTSRDFLTVSRSVSMMKRDQSRALRATNATATNSIVHTDGGLRLTAGTAPDEIPPQYVPE
ncbi:hypothetical protein B0H13DRAFT_2423529 [Mycena leptocephala]|nr:hypothetical protein B0H13DRAFT_2423529 [Mycena leptocephala]